MTRIIRLVADPANNDSQLVDNEPVERLLIEARQGWRGYLGKPYRYFGTNLGIVRGFGIEQFDGIKKVYMEFEVTNHRNWDRFDLSVRFIPAFSSWSPTGIELDGFSFCLSVKERAEPFQEV